MPNYAATGAEELLIALQTPMRDFIGVPVLAWGEPGQGKTSFLESLAQDAFPVYQLIASIHDPTDFGGLPVYENGCVRMMPPEWAHTFQRTQQGVLFLDDIHLCTPAVQGALLRVVLERRVGTLPLPARVRVAAAANPPDKTFGGWELSLPLANRFVHLTWSLSGSAFADALRYGFTSPTLPIVDPLMHEEAAFNWRSTVAAFLSRDPSLANTQPAEGEYAFASPRSWYDFAINLMASCECLRLAPRPGGAKGSRVFYNLIEGSVGSGAAKAFVGFLKSLQLPDPDKVLDGEEACNVESMKDDEIHVFFSSLANCLLRRREAAKGDVLDATLVTLELVKQVSATGRVDTVFAPVRQIALGQTLQAASAAAYSAGRVAELQKQLREVFENTSLAEYVSALKQQGGSDEMDED